MGDGEGGGIFVAFLFGRGLSYPQFIGGYLSSIKCKLILSTNTQYSICLTKFLPKCKESKS